MENFILIRVDGGIGSQVPFCALGVEFEKRGYKVKYDLFWYKQNAGGIDFKGALIEGKMFLNFDMPKAFPKMKFEIATFEECEEYYKKYDRTTWRINYEATCFAPPAAFQFYPKRMNFLIKHRDIFAENFAPKMSENFYKLCQRIKKEKACGVHVRQGDMAGHTKNYDKVFGLVPNASYYKNAIRIISALNPGVKFYFFSDEIEWVRKFVLPDLEVEYEIVEQNDITNGYLDLYALFCCTHIISSLGSLGKVARLFSKTADNGNFIVAKCDESVKSFENTIVLGRQIQYLPQSTKELLVLNNHKIEILQIANKKAKKEKSPKFSILIYCSTCGADIVYALESVLCQLYSDFECFVIGDFIDKNYEISVLKNAIKFYDSRLKFYKTSEFLGAGKALKIAANLANGEILVPILGSDILESDALFQIEKKLNSTNCAIFGSSCAIDKENSLFNVNFTLGANNRADLLLSITKGNFQNFNIFRNFAAFYLDDFLQFWNEYEKDFSEAIRQIFIESTFNSKVVILESIILRIRVDEEIIKSILLTMQNTQK